VHPRREEGGSLSRRPQLVDDDDAGDDNDDDDDDDDDNDDDDDDISDAYAHGRRGGSTSYGKTGRSQLDSPVLVPASTLSTLTGRRRGSPRASGMLAEDGRRRAIERCVRAHVRRNVAVRGGRSRLHPRCQDL